MKEKPFEAFLEDLQLQMMKLAPKNNWVQGNF